MIETQKRWYIPAPASLGWQIGCKPLLPSCVWIDDILILSVSLSLSPLQSGTSSVALVSCYVVPSDTQQRLAIKPPTRVHSLLFGVDGRF